MEGADFLSASPWNSLTFNGIIGYEIKRKRKNKNMQKQILKVFIGVMLAMAVTACGKKEETVVDTNKSTT